MQLRCEKCVRYGSGGEKRREKLLSFLENFGKAEELRVYLVESSLLRSQGIY